MSEPTTIERLAPATVYLALYEGRAIPAIHPEDLFSLPDHVPVLRIEKPIHLVPLVMKHRPFGFVATIGDLRATQRDAVILSARQQKKETTMQDDYATPPPRKRRKAGAGLAGMTKADRRAYGEAVEKAILAKQRQR
jgi:hypothetical protein